MLGPPSAAHQPLEQVSYKLENTGGFMLEIHETGFTNFLVKPVEVEY